jgi:hypothetical protein
MRRGFSGPELAARDRTAFRLETLFVPRLNARLARLRTGSGTLAAERP